MITVLKQVTTLKTKDKQLWYQEVMRSLNKQVCSYIRMWLCGAFYLVYVADNWPVQLLSCSPQQAGELSARLNLNGKGVVSLDDICQSVLALQQSGHGRLLVFFCFSVFR